MAWIGHDRIFSNLKWFRNLKPEYKLFYLYLWYESDHVGLMEIDMEKAEFDIKRPYDLAETQIALLPYVIVKNGYWFIKEATIIRWGVLSPETNRAHIKYYNTLEHHDLLQEYESTMKLRPKKEVKKVEFETDVRADAIHFDDFWVLYDKKTTKNKAREKWLKISVQDQHDIMAYVPKYKKAQPDKKYRKDPIRFLTHEVWKDEIIGETTITLPKATTNEVLNIGRNLEN